MGVSGVAVTVAGCDMPSFIASQEGVEEVVSYLSPEEFVIPGVGVWYASVCMQCPAGCGVRGRIREGRLLKLEGNPESSLNAGKLCQMGQAGLQNHYDPDRVTTPLARKGGKLAEVTWEQALTMIEEKTGAGSSIPKNRFAWFTGTVSGHQGVLMKSHLEAMGSTAHFVHETINNQVWRTVSKDMLGLETPRLRFDKAKLVLSFGADFLGTWMSPIHFSGQYARFRSTPDRGMLIQAEPSMTLTGANADMWLAVRPETEGAMALGIANILIKKEKVDASALPESVLDAIDGYDVTTTSRITGIAGDRLIRIVRHLKDLSPSLIVAGASACGHVNGYQSAAAAMLLNFLLGNIGKTIEPGENFSFPQLRPAEGGTRDLARFAKAAGEQQFDAVFFYGANPLFAAPAHMNMAEKLDAIPFKAAFSQFMDETTARADLVLPVASPMEDWGTHVPAYQGDRNAIVFQQPLMEPLYPGVRGLGDLLLGLVKMRNPGPLDDFEDYYAYLQNAFAAIPGALKGEGGDEDAPFDKNLWNRVLQNGHLEVPGAKRSFDTKVFAPDVAGHRENADYPYYLAPTPRAGFYDGRHANLSWLQEAPDQITKIVWNSWAEINPSTAAKLGVEQGDIVKITAAGGSIEATAYLHKGVHPDVVVVPMGQGHEEYGRYATGIGVNPLKILDPLSDGKTGEMALYGTRVKLARTGRSKKLVKAGDAETQHGRKIVATITADHLRRTEGES
ncbi:MAG: molybdopterin-dependent oxidoreductase [Rhodospirillales bacterium]